MIKFWQLSSSLLLGTSASLSTKTLTIFAPNSILKEISQKNREVILDVAPQKAEKPYYLLTAAIAALLIFKDKNDFENQTKLFEKLKEETNSSGDQEIHVDERTSTFLSKLLGGGADYHFNVLNKNFCSSIAEVRNFLLYLEKSLETGYPIFLGHQEDSTENGVFLLTGFREDEDDLWSSQIYAMNPENGKTETILVRNLSWYNQKKAYLMGLGDFDVLPSMSILVSHPGVKGEKGNLDDGLENSLGKININLTYEIAIRDIYQFTNKFKSFSLPDLTTTIAKFNGENLTVKGWEFSTAQIPSEDPDLAFWKSDFLKIAFVEEESKTGHLESWTKVRCELIVTPLQKLNLNLYFYVGAKLDSIDAKRLAGKISLDTGKKLFLNFK